MNSLHILLHVNDFSLAEKLVVVALYYWQVVHGWMCIAKVGG